MSQLRCFTCNGVFAENPLWGYCPYCGANLEKIGSDDLVDLQRRIELLEDMFKEERNDL